MSRVKFILGKDAAITEDAHVKAVRNLLESCNSLAASKFALYAAGHCPVRPTEEMIHANNAIEACLNFPTQKNVSEVAIKLEPLILSDEGSQSAALRWATKATAQAVLAMLTYSLDEGNSAPLAREYALKADCFALESVESAARESTARVPPGYVHGGGDAVRVRLVMASAEARLMARLNELAHPKLADAEFPEKRE